LRSYFIWDPLIWLYTIVLGSLSLLSSLVDGSGRVQHRFARLWSRMILGTIGARVTVTGLDAIDTARAHVYVVNHLSALDIPVLYRYLPFQFRIIAHRVVFRVPLVGWHLRASRQLMIDPDSIALSRRTLREAVQTLKQGMPLVVFPEGERSPNGEMLPFRRGAFYVAVAAQADIVPMAVLGTYEAFPRGSAHLRPGRLQLMIGDAIPVAGYTRADLGTLAERTQQAVAGLLAEGKKKQLAIGS
jgi:1-acyl-sn-glycerol-3-phosphate acyltransferase